MKKLVFLAFIAFFAVVTVFAQTTTVNGTLQLKEGTIAISDGKNLYFVPSLERYVGFIEGLKEGARVSVEGYVFENDLKPTKLSINGKSYDLTTKNRGLGRGNGYGHRMGYGRGHGGCGGYCGGGCWRFQ